MDFTHGMRVNRSLKEKETAPESLTAFEFDKDEQGKPFMWCGGGAYGLMAYDTSEKKFFYFKNDPRDKYTHNLGQAVMYFVIPVQVLFGSVRRMVWKNMIRIQFVFDVIAYGRMKTNLPIHSIF
jgi:hypothetical protein